MKKIILAPLFISILFADTIGGEIAIGLFNHSPSGETKYQTTSNIDLVDTLGFSSTQDIFLVAYLEHPLPLVPNLKLSYNTLSTSANHNVNTFSWGEIEKFSGPLSSNISLNYTDATLYYEVLDNGLALDVGATIRSLKGEISLKSTQTNNVVSYTANIPLLYTKIRFYIPSTEFSLQAEVNAISFSSARTYDYTVSARYTSVMGLGVEAGYKTFYFSDNKLISGLENNINFSGFYASAIWDF